MSKPPASQLNRLIEHVRRRHDATEDEILDLLWCLERGHLRWGTVAKVEPTKERGLDQPPPKPPPVADGQPPGLPPGSDPKKGGGGDKGTEVAETTEETKPQPQEVQFFHEGGARWDRDQERQFSDNDEGLTTVRIAGAAALGGEAELLARALRPLQTRRQIRPGDLDEARTVDNAVQWGYPLPAWKQDRATPFVLTVVLDGSRSTGFWTAWAEAWCQVLRVGCRARVDVWHLVPDASGAGFLISSRAGGRGAVPHVIGRSVPRRQILLFSDMVAPWWFSGHLPALLERWARVHTVTVVTPVPPRVWERNAVAEFRRGIARVPHQRRARWVDWDGERPEEAPVFLLRIEKGAVAGWAETVTGRGSGGHLALAFPANEPLAPLPKLSEPQERPALPLKTLKLRLERALEGGILSKAACDLVEVLAAAPLTPGLMRLVQRGIFPGQSHEVLAEVVYSRLIARQGAQLAQTDPDRLLYDFYAVEGVPDEEGWMRRELMRERRWDQLEKVQTCVGSYLEDHIGLDLHAIEALVLRQGADAATALPEGWEPFARVLGQVWPHLGGQRAEQGRRIREWVRLGIGGGKTIEDRPSALENSVGMTMLGIPSGTFTMGSPADEPGRDDDDFALHQVTLSHPFRIAHTPVTQKQWMDVMGTTMAEQKAKGNDYGGVTGTGDDHPVYFVNWEDALRFCDALTEKENRRAEGLAYALPTEAQWEFACRAGTHGPHNVNWADLVDLGWFSKNSGRSTHPVGEKTPNAWGLHDCHGNIWEWCADWFELRTSTESVRDPQGPPSGGDRVLRGGSWRYDARHCRSASRLGYSPRGRYDGFGFRPVLSPVKQREAQGVLPPEPEAVAQPEPEVQEEAARSVRPHFVPIKAGTFLMGSPENEEGRLDREDLHQVTLTQDFEIADTPVTQAQYEAVMGSNPSKFQESGPDAPVEQVTWNDAVAFCEKLTAEDPEWIYRLPTEAEWEYACRAGTKGRWNVDGADLKDLSWYDENSEKKTHPVRQMQPNAWGLHDCHGNVLEWCQDWFTEHLGSEAVKDPQGPESGDDRVLRGGSWSSFAQYCRSAIRYGRGPGDRFYYDGFRPVRMKKGEGTALEAVAQPEPEAGARSSAWIARDFDVPAAPGMKMLCIGAGDFLMGEGGEAHPVKLTEDFFVAETPVTQAQYEVVMGTNPSHFKQVGPEAPVEPVSWDDAMAFCAKLNQNAEPEDGWEWSLPTEAQWEYACRAGTTTAFSFGNVLNGTQANCDGNHPYGTEEKGPYLERTSPVRNYPANPWGLYDCHGNVWEWCADWYGEYPKEAVVDPQGPESAFSRVLRGGSWDGTARNCRSAIRSGRPPGLRGNGGTGFRPVLTRKKQAEGTELEAVAQPEPEAGARSRRADYVAADFANGLGMEMVCLEPGTFTMGSPADEEGREPGSSKETQHQVTLTEPFWIAKTPVTQGAWRTLIGTTVAAQKAKGNSYGELTGTGDDHPVYFVNWEEALAACDRLSIQERDAGRLPDGYLYTLPTEAQWEYACRAGTEGAFNVEGARLQDLGWYADNSGKSTHASKAKTPNAWGLHDCHGNVWEWCADWYLEDLGTESAQDPKGPKSGEDRVLRGGTWGDHGPHCRSANRGRYDLGFRLNRIGFRPVLSTRMQRTELAALPAELVAVVQPTGTESRSATASTTAGHIRPVFVPIRPGKFLMGSPRNEKDREPGDAKETQHEVTLTYAFEIADAPVTQAQYEAVMGTNPSHFKESGSDAPVEAVSLKDAVEWCRKMSSQDPHYDYRLPTEAEWEYACRAGTTGPFNLDGVKLDDLGWYSANAGGRTHSVKQKLPNNWGLYDCHGNVVEWCAESYTVDLGFRAVTDPVGRPRSYSVIVRGGYCDDSARECRSAFRNRADPEQRHHGIGFRPVRTKKAQVTEPPSVAQPESDQTLGSSATARSPRRGLFGGLFGGKR